MLTTRPNETRNSCYTKIAALCNIGRTPAKKRLGVLTDTQAKSPRNTKSTTCGCGTQGSLQPDFSILDAGNTALSVGLSPSGVPLGVLGVLGKTTKNADTFVDEVVDSETGEVFKYQEVKKKDGSPGSAQIYDQTAADSERWMLKKYARHLLMHFEDRQKKVKRTYSPYCDLETREELVNMPSYCDIQNRLVFQSFTGRIKYEPVVGIKKKSPVYRVINCARSKISASENAEIWESYEQERCSFHKVALCGSVWHCATCSRKINLQRQKQIRSCYEAFQGQKAYDVLMVTFTIKHGMKDQLDVLFRLLNDADRKQMQKSYRYKKIVGYKRKLKGQTVRIPGAYDYAGRISATELTYGKKHGWHPHKHQLWFFDRRLTKTEIEEIRSELFQAWRDACVAVGLPAPAEFHNGKAIGVDVRRALSAEQYIAKYGCERKWSPEREMASSHVKAARKGGKTPFELLYDASQGDDEAAALFQVYAKATLGKHQLEFSPGLKARLELLMPEEDLEKSDEEMAAMVGKDSVKLGTLTDTDFEALGEYRGPLEPYGTTLALAKVKGFDAAVAFIRSLPSYRAPVAPASTINRQAIFDQYTKQKNREEAPIDVVERSMLFDQYRDYKKPWAMPDCDVARAAMDRPLTPDEVQEYLRVKKGGFPRRIEDDMPPCRHDDKYDADNFEWCHGVEMAEGDECPF